MSENQTADNHISEVGTAQTAGGNQTEAVGEQASASSGNQTEDSSAFEAEMNAMWGLETEEEAVHDEEEAAQEESPESTEPEEPVEEDAEQETEEEQEETEEPQAPAQEALTLNFMGTNLNVSLDEAKALAQKGLTADRLSAKYDRLKPLEVMLEPMETMAYM